MPIVMARAFDPVGAGFVRFARPGGNTTGFTQFEFALAGKWLELLKEIAPQVTRVGVAREPIGRSLHSGRIEAVAPLGVEFSPINMHIAGDTERAVSEFAPAPKDGLIVIVGTVATIQRALIMVGGAAQAARGLSLSFLC